VSVKKLLVFIKFLGVTLKIQLKEVSENVTDTAHKITKLEHKIATYKMA